MSRDSERLAELGPNAGLVEELYRQYLEDPNSVAEGWRDYFGNYASEGAGSATPATQVAPAAAAKPAKRVPPTPEGTEPLRGAAARIVENMERSLAVPTATSVRTIPAKLLEVNRKILNNQLKRVGRGKVSFTHIIGWAIVRATARVPAMNASFHEVDGEPTIKRTEPVHLGLAVDVEKRDGSRTLLVPNVKNADALDFAGFVSAFDDLLRRSRSGGIQVADLEGTTLSITNPGMIGTVHSMPRLMPGQGAIIGVGAITWPPGYEAADPSTLARIGVGKVVTLTSTYDHRIIQGAESGEFLGTIHRLLLGEEGFYQEIFGSLDIPYEPAVWNRDQSPADDSLAAHEKAVQVHDLINLYRQRGHLIANLDPLGRTEPETHSELDPLQHGLTIWDLDREFPTIDLGPERSMKLGDILRILRNAYSRTIGLEYMHIQDPEQKRWIQERIEIDPPPPTPERKRRILDRLVAAEAFETFLHTKFLGHKRFGIEGAESLIPMLDALLDAASDEGVEEAVIGMAHRGRLNVLANVIGKSYSQIFREFEGQLDPDAPQGSGDVKYHLGAQGSHATLAGRNVDIHLASNPSHLEAVDPVVLGMVRARQDVLDDEEGRRVLPILIHGDAAFAGQGVVGETLNLSALPGYEVGGTVHVVVNNQLGFTTAPTDARSSFYATDVAQMVQAPIFHVNGDDPEACVRVVELAVAYRHAFHRDVVVDMICYRRHGHNEADEPAFTQPQMYHLIEEKRTVRKLYMESLVNRGDIGLEEAEATFSEFRTLLDGAFSETDAETRLQTVGRHFHAKAHAPIPTGVERGELERVIDAVSKARDGFGIHPKLERQLAGRRRAFDSDAIDWALAESLAIGSLLLEGTPVRLAGQDTRRGTFSQRHAVLVDQVDETEDIPLTRVAPDQAPLRIYDSLLSEYAVLGFEFGYSTVSRDALVCWEAQFGDFANGAQIVIDQFIATAEDKWSEHSSLTLLLPHGYDGQGPEHSSARIERFLILCAEENLRVVYPTTAAQYFHVLRRQVKNPVRVPLICFTPKRYLRMPPTFSRVEDLTDGHFQRVLDDPNAPPEPKRVLLCSGKIAHELREWRDKEQLPVVVLSLEELYPFPREELGRALDAIPHETEIFFVQEEPRNMGAWHYVRGEMTDQLPGRRVRGIARDRSASPATGSSSMHAHEQRLLLESAFDGLSGTE